MTTKQPRIYLCSKSPRRRELLKQIEVNYEILWLRSDPSRNFSVSETPQVNENALEYVQRVCILKARAGWDVLSSRHLSPFPVLAADTTVSLDGKIIGKPRDNSHAAEILHSLSGRQHQVLTAVALCFEDRFDMRISSTTVTFAKLDEARIQRYLLGNEVLDKAGAYGIQGYAGAFVERIEGSYTGVMGLPLFETVELLKSLDYPAT
jgi:septum formation protein